MKIIVGVDGSKQSDRAVEWCATYAGPLDAEVVAVHAIESVVYPAPFPGAYPLPHPLSQIDRDEMQAHIASEWCAPLVRASVPVRVVLMDGEPARVIMDVADTEGADLVVTGKRGRGGFAELVLGSTSHALSHHLDRPLVIVP